jgi:hypothetical protein
MPTVDLSSTDNLHFIVNFVDVMMQLQKKRKGGADAPCSATSIHRCLLDINQSSCRIAKSLWGGFSDSIHHAQKEVAQGNALAIDKASGVERPSAASGEQDGEIGVTSPSRPASATRILSTEASARCTAWRRWSTDASR